MSRMKEYILYYRKKIEKNKEDEAIVVDSIIKLGKTSVTAELLKETEIFYMMRSLALQNNQIGRVAFPIYKKWKNFLSIASKSKDSAIDSKKNSQSPVVKKEKLDHSNSKKSLTVNPVDVPPQSMEDQNGSQDSYYQYKDGADADNPHLNIDGLTGTEHGLESDYCGTKGSRGIVEPYSIEMKEGMFRVVKIEEDPISKKKMDSIKKNRLLNLKKALKSQSEWYPLDESSDYNSEGSGQEKGITSKMSSSPVPVKIKAVKLESKVSPSKLEFKKCDTRDSPSNLKFKSNTNKKSPSQLVKLSHHNDINHNNNNCDKKVSRKQDSPNAESMSFMVSKKDRRSVYSGRKTNYDIPTLKLACIRVLRKNIDVLRCDPSISYGIMKPVLEHLSPTLLAKFEEHNKHYLQATNELWKQHCNRDYRTKVPGPGESWKRVYNRASLDQDRRLKNVAANISASASKAKPDRPAKITFMEVPLDPQRKRAKKSYSPSPSPLLKETSPTPTKQPKDIQSPKEPKNISPKQPKNISPKLSKESRKPVAAKKAAPLMSKLKRSMGLVHRSK